MAMTPAEKTTKFERHLTEIAAIAKRIGERLDLKADAQQACFATILISADKHGVFFDVANPELPKNGLTQSVPVPHAPSKVIDPNDTAGADLRAATKADEQIKDVSRHPTEAEAEAGSVKALREGVKVACRQLNAEGFTPNLRPTTIDAYIQKETEMKTPYLEMDSADLEALTKNLSLKLDEIRAKKKAQEAGAGF